MTSLRIHAQLIFVLLICFVCLLLSPFKCNGQQPGSSAEYSEKALKQFLQKELNDPGFDPDKTTRFSSAIIQSDSTTKEEIVVYISGRTWCGSSGCRMLVLQPYGTSFTLIGETTITRLPIRILRSSSHGRADIGVWVQGGGIQPGYEAALRFDGRSYPSNPSVAPARRLSAKEAGKVIIGSLNYGQLLYE